MPLGNKDRVMETKKRSAKLLCNEAGSKGRYTIHFQVLDKDDLPVEGAVIRILDRDLPDGYLDLPPTDKYGAVIFKLEFESEERIFSVVVLGTPISTWMNFFN